jgi:DNA helicase-2/ATP-dependent DNA helicase PcrA
VERVRAAFHYVRRNQTVRPAGLPDGDDLAALLAAARDPARQEVR